MRPDRPVDHLNSSMASMNVRGSGMAKSSKLVSMLDNKRSTDQENRPKIPPIPQENGWKTVDHTKPKSAMRPTDGNRQRPPSAAADSRRKVYETSAKPKSIHKQVMLPPEERDPTVEDIEANKGVVLHKSQFKPGMIIRGKLHEQDYKATSSSSNITIADPYRSDTKFGPICTKYRKMIVIALFEDHYLSIPVFTHNGHGLADKTKTEEYIGIKDHRAKEEGLRQSRHEPLVTEFITSGIDLFDAKSTAHVTYALSRKYDLSLILEGHLTKSSTNRLIRVFKQFAPTELKDRNGKIY
ncbi:MAG: hypothetical protein LQ348_007593 [Seirophora lacunosa]|nr:MAG: hypothetical protein LQ348_007593 [Seirophora lacunosa]